MLGEPYVFCGRSWWTGDWVDLASGERVQRNSECGYRFPSLIAGSLVAQGHETLKLDLFSTYRMGARQKKPAEGQTLDRPRPLRNRREAQDPQLRHDATQPTTARDEQLTGRCRGNPGGNRHRDPPGTHTAANNRPRPNEH